jgi:Flp pilus assembly protein TadG
MSLQGGTGLIGTAAGALVFVVLLLFAVQVAAGLLATTTVTAVGFDAARAVASRQVDHHDPTAVASAELRAEAGLRSALGGLGRRAEVRWATGTDVVRLRLRVRAPGVLPTSLAGPLGRHTIDRTFTVRVEELR